MSLDSVVLPAAAGVTSFAGTLSLAAGVAPVPSSIPEWVPYLTTIVGPVLVVVAGRVLAAIAAAKRKSAALKRERARKLLADKNPANDAEASKLEDQAATDDVVADALEALKAPKAA